MKKNTVDAVALSTLPVLAFLAFVAWIWYTGNERQDARLAAGILAAQEDYAQLAAKVAEHNHLAGGVSTWSPEKGVRCSAFLWKGKIGTATHCRPVIPNPRISEPDPMVELNDADARRLDEAAGTHPAFTADLYEIGLECSPDLRWWGQTTGEVVHIAWEDVVVQRRALREEHKLEEGMEAYRQGDLPMAGLLLRQWQNASRQVEYCVKASHGGYAQHGDSGGPLLAGDEVIGALSIGGDVFDTGNRGTCWTSGLADVQTNATVQLLELLISAD
jgi:hypothetical protein